MRGSRGAVVLWAVAVGALACGDGQGEPGPGTPHDGGGRLEAGASLRDASSRVDAASTGPTGASSDCSSIDADLASFAADNRDCTDDVDCGGVNGDCTPVVQVCGLVYLAVDYDAVGFGRLLDRYRACNGEIDCAACSSPAPAAVCVDGRCGPMP